MNEVERSGVRRVKILKAQDQRLRLRERLERVGQIAQRTGRDVAGGRAGEAPDATQRLGDRQIGFAGTVLLDAAGVRDQRGVSLRQRREIHAEQARFTAAGLPAHEHDATLAAARALERRVQASQLRAAPHPGAGFDRWTADLARRARFGRAGQGADEAVSEAVGRLHEARAPRRVAQRVADLFQRRLQHRVADGNFSPEGREQLLLLDQAPWVFHQVTKHRERLRPQHDRPPVAPELLAMEIQVERRESQIAAAVNGSSV